MSGRSGYGSVEKVGDRVYRIRWTEGGKRHSKNFHGTLMEARRYLAEREVDGGSVSRSVTWSRYWRDFVEPTLDGLAEHTKKEYRDTWEKRLAPSIGSCSVHDTTWRTVQDAVSALDAPSAQRKAYRLMRKMCNMAVRDGLLSSNPAVGVKVKEDKKRRKRLLTSEDVPAFLDSIRGIKYEPMVLMEVGGGLRHEEACAITWADVQEIDGYAVLSVTKARTCVDGASVLKSTKNGFSEREVVIGEPFASRLLELKGKKRGQVYGSLPTTATHNWKIWCSRNGVEYIPFGTMRSCYATLMGEAGAIDSLVSLSMGHSDGTTRGKYYQQATRRGLMMIADLLAQAIIDTRD